MSVRSLCAVTACLLTLAAASSGRADDRDYWKHNDGSFKQVKGEQWLEVLKDKKIDLVEKNRTDEYVELFDPGRKISIRLFADRCEALLDPKSSYKKVHDGKWVREGADTAKPPTPAPPPAAKTDERVMWQHSVGHFQKIKDDKWLEAWKTDRHEWVEKARTDEYVELYDASRKSTVRLFDNRCELKYDSEDKFKKHYDGKWKKEPASTTTPPADPKPSDPKPDPKPTATGKPEDRDYWSYADGHFERVKEGQWVEVIKGETKYEFTERKRTDEYVEIEDRGRKVGVTLYADHADVTSVGPLKSVNKTTRQGKWGKDAGDPAAAGTAPKPAPAARAKAEWVDGVAKMKFPEGVVAGKLNGLDFEPNQVTYSLSDRSLRFSWKSPDNKGVLPDLDLTLDVANLGNSGGPIKVGKVPEGVTLKKNFRESTKDYIMHVSAEDRTPNNKTGIGVLAVPDWAYVIEYTGKQGDKLAGKVYICSGDDKKHFLAGSFEATIVK